MIVGFYIADFVFPSRMLIIELDGPSHKGREEYDKKRDGFLKACGFDVLRITNSSMRSFDVSLIAKYPKRTQVDFRSALARANALKGNAMKRKKRPKYRKGDEPVSAPMGILDRVFHSRYLQTLKSPRQ